MVRKPWIEWSLKGIALAALVFAVWRDFQYDDWNGPGPTAERQAQKIPTVAFPVDKAVATGAVGVSPSVSPGVYPVTGPLPEGRDFTSLLPSSAASPRFLAAPAPVRLLIVPPAELAARGQFALQRLSLTGAVLSVSISGSPAKASPAGRVAWLVDLGGLPAGPYRVDVSLALAQRAGESAEKARAETIAGAFFVNPAPDKGWGKAVGGLRARTLVSTWQAPRGGRVALKFEVNNCSNKPVTILAAGELFADLWPVLRDRTGAVVPIVPAARKNDTHKMAKIDVAPGAVQAFPVQFSTAEGFREGALPPGDYRLELSCGVSKSIAVKHDCESCWIGIVTAMAVPMTVRPGK